MTNVNRIKYYDLLRAIAIFSVLASHIFLIWPHAEIMNFKIISFRQIFMFAVPLFLMLSGALLLGRDISLGDFFKRRFSRIIYPFIFFLVIFVAVMFWMMGSLPGLSDSLATVPFQYNWFFWLIVGVYLAVPVINKFIRYSSEREIEYFLIVLFCGSLFYQVMFFLHIDHYINLALFLSPVAYLVLGYYLANKDFSLSNSSVMALSVVIFLAVTVIKMISVDGMLPFDYVTGYAMTSSDYVATLVDIGVLELLRTSAIFMFFRCLFDSRNKLRDFVEGRAVTAVYTSYSRASYGIYLFQITLFAPLKIIFSGMSLTGSEVFLVIVVLIFAFNIVCWLIVLLISRIPFIGKLSGYH